MLAPIDEAVENRVFRPSSNEAFTLLAAVPGQNPHSRACARLRILKLLDRSEDRSSRFPPATHRSGRNLMDATVSLGRGRDRVEGEFSIERWIALHDMISTIQSRGAGHPPRNRVGLSAGRSGSPPRIAPRTTPPARTAARSPPQCQMRLPFQRGHGKVSALRDRSPLGWERRRATPSILILLHSPMAPRRMSSRRRHVSKIVGSCSSFVLASLALCPLVLVRVPAALLPKSLRPLDCSEPPAAMPYRPHGR